MKTVLFILSFCLMTLSASVNFTYPDLSKCFTKVSKSFKHIKGVKAFAYDSRYFISIQKNKNVACDLYDEFTKVCLIKKSSKQYLKKCRPVKVANFLASMNEEKIFISNFAQKASLLRGFNTLKDSFSSAIVLNDCCEIVGIGSSKDKFISHKYIKHLISKKSGIYTTLGFSVKNEKGQVVVDKVFEKDVSLKKGDVILKVANKKINTVYDFNDYSLFLKPNKVYSVVYEGNKVAFTKAKIIQKNKKLYLKSEKVWINEKLLVIKTENYLRKIGDKLLEVDKKVVNSFNDVLDLKKENSKYTFVKKVEKAKEVKIKKVDKNYFWIEKKL